MNNINEGSRFPIMVEEMNVDAGEDITPKRDGGILKKITVEGSGTNKPANGCKVTVHYTGTLLDGSVFDSSRTRDSPFKFQLGKGKVIQGWDIGVATMKLGERAVFTIREDYAYGEAGSPPKIPSKATLVFDIELISWEPENLSGKKDRGILRFPIMVEEMNVDAGEDITPKRDGGILKKITVEGSGTNKPANGCKVTVHYTGTLLDGSVFDSSRTRDSPFKFQLGKGKVIQGWDIGVATMKLGERAVFTIREDYAYGEAGSPPKIPSKATLVFDIELISWEPENLSGKKDRGILRYPLTAGAGFENPKEMAEVKVKLKGEVEGRVFDEREISFNLGEGKVHDIPPGIDKALESFVLNETSELELTPEYGFGAEGNAKFNVPPNATLKYTVTLKSFEKIKDRWMLSNEEKVEESKRLKEKGTNYFKAGQFDLALKLYNKVTEYLNGSAGFENELEEERKSLELAGHLNAAMCHLKLNNHLDAKNSCNVALEIDPENQKALFRRGQAYLGLSEPELAKADFDKVVSLDSTNKAAFAQIVICNQKLKEIRSKEKQMYANMFEKFAQKDREWRFGWLEGEKPQVDVVPDDPEILEMRKKRREQKVKYLETTARLLKEKKEREERERLEREKDEQERLARGEPLEGELHQEGIEGEADKDGDVKPADSDGVVKPDSADMSSNSTLQPPQATVEQQPASLPIDDQPQSSEVTQNTCNYAENTSNTNSCRLLSF